MPYGVVPTHLPASAASCSPSAHMATPAWPLYIHHVEGRVGPVSPQFGNAFCLYMIR